MGVSKYIDYLIKESADEPPKPAAKGEKKVKQPDQIMFLSDKFKKVLADIQSMKQSNISKRLLELDGSTDRLFDISYVDVDDDGENVSYLQANRIDRLKAEGKPIDEFWTSRLRVKQKIGRFITQMLPKFNEDSIQKFTKKFKVVLKEGSEQVSFELVEGDDIVYWYDARNYETDDGTMGSSCMSGPEAGQYLNCYRNNPNQCKLIILKSEDNPDKIKGRAIVWKLTTPKDKIFMDRIYTNNDDDELLFINYAKKQGWYSKDVQKYGSTNIVIPGEGSKDLYMEVELDNTNYKLYPYVDTLRYFYPEKKIMASSQKYDDEYYTLTDTEGHYDEYKGEGDDADPLVYDGYNDVEIPESRATWCQYDNSYITSEDAIRLSYNNTFAFPKSQHIVWSDYTKKWYAKNDAVFCKPLNSWIWNKYVVDVYHDKNKELPPDKTHRFELGKTIGKVGDDYYDIDLLYVKNKKVVPKKHAIRPAMRANR